MDEEITVTVTQKEKRVQWSKLQRLKQKLESKGELDLQKKAEIENLEANLSLFPEREAKGNTLKVLRSIGLAFALFLWFFVIVLLLPLRFLHPLLRKVGFKNNTLPMDLVQKYYVKSLLMICGVHVKIDGVNQINRLAKRGKSTIGLFQHSSNLDFAIVAGHSPIYYKWIAKRSVFFIPVFGWLGFLLGMIPIDRSDRSKAINSLGRARQVMEEWDRSIAIAPEGTRSKNGQLGPFKKGPFYLALESKVPLCPILIFGAYELWPPGQLFCDSGSVIVRYLRPIKVKPGETVDSLVNRVYLYMLRGMEDYPEHDPPGFGVPFSFWIQSLFVLTLVYVLFFSFCWWVWVFFG
eukprot:TRINITY_DN6598_c0_g1_i1.p1 TRINITY_DN6598_c0_g1~~TRINITY_DN6598_c0_g1_i1.p1  ORF type:complete len:350 (+),score=45.59 TRINITY_DN6598_c0_g1_i1:48-1097(+)